MSGSVECDPAGFCSRTVGCGPRPQSPTPHSGAGGVGSVDHFHHQLELLEHAGPKLVAPAYRLRAGRSGANSSAAASSRPKLVLLRAVSDGQAADIDDVDGARYARVGVIEPPEPPVSAAQTHAELAGYRRQQARQRCTFVLRLLAAAAVSTGILGALPSSGWPGSSPGSPGLPPWPWRACSPTPASSKDNGGRPRHE